MFRVRMMITAYIDTEDNEAGQRLATDIADSLKSLADEHDVESIRAEACIDEGEMVRKEPKAAKAGKGAGHAAN